MAPSTDVLRRTLSHRRSVNNIAGKPGAEALLARRGAVRASGESASRRYPGRPVVDSTAAPARRDRSPGGLDRWAVFS